MASFSEIIDSIKTEFFVRYKSPIWGAVIFVIIAAHWKILIFFLTEKPNSTEAIKFIEENSSAMRIGIACLFAVAYTIFFPWVELYIAKAAARGKQLRNEFQTKEREREIHMRELIAQQQAKLIKLEQENSVNQSLLADTELAKNYQSILSGENFSRWLKDIYQGAVNAQIQNTISNGAL